MCVHRPTTRDREACVEPSGRVLHLVTSAIVADITKLVNYLFGTLVDILCDKPTRAA
jgi:hypothetical protein